jgi:hypothetical protein
LKIKGDFGAAVWKTMNVAVSVMGAITPAKGA